MLFTSCKKDWTCTCTALGTTTPVPYTKLSKKDATTACDQANASYALLGGSCKLD